MEMDEQARMEIESRELIYGMPYDAWKDKYQTEATPGQKAAFEKQHE